MTIDKETMRKLYGEYVKGVQREGKKMAVAEPLSFAEWQADFSVSLEYNPASGVNYSMTELRRLNKEMINSSKRTLTRRQNRALETSFESGNWGDELSSEEAVEVHQFLAERGYYEAKESGQLRQWFAFNGADFRDMLEAMNLSSWHMFFNS